MRLIKRKTHHLFSLLKCQVHPESKIISNIYKSKKWQLAPLKAELIDRREVDRFHKVLRDLVVKTYECVARVHSISTSCEARVYVLLCELITHYLYFQQVGLVLHLRLKNDNCVSFI